MVTKLPRMFDEAVDVLAGFHVQPRLSVSVAGGYDASWPRAYLPVPLPRLTRCVNPITNYRVAAGTTDEFIAALGL